MTERALAALRSAAPDAYFVLDDDDRIVHVSKAFHDTRGRSVGHVFWDHLPRAREVYGPHFEEARATGRPVEATIFYSGRLKRLLVLPGGVGRPHEVAHSRSRQLRDASQPRQGR